MVNAFRLMVFVIGLAVVIGSIMVTSAEDLVIISIDSPSDGEMVYSKKITVSGIAAAMGVHYIDSVTVNKAQAGRDTWSADILLQEGPNRITVVATTDIGNTATETITVFYKAPTPTLTQTGGISITTIPSGAVVYLDYFFAGITPITLGDVTVGFHLINVIKEGYHSVTKKIYFSTVETRELYIELEPITGSIVVSSTPSGASVYLDNVDMKANTTCMLSEVVVVPHTIKLTKSGYFDVIIRNVPVSDTSTTYLHENLTAYGSIDISSDPSGAEIYLDGNYTGEATPKNISKVVVGDHTIKLTKSDYFDEIINVSLSVGETLHLHENLTGYGSLRISSIPPGANVFVNGNYTGKTPLDIPKVLEGWHTIKLTRQDYADVVQMVYVSPGESPRVGETLLVLEAAFISKIEVLIVIIFAIIGLLILTGLIVSRRERYTLSKSIMKKADVRPRVESRQKIDFAKRKDIILLNSPEWTKHKDYPKINPLYKKAQELEKRGENKESIETYEEIIDINEYYIKAWEGLERIYNVLGETEKKYPALKKTRAITEFIDFATNAAQKITLQQFNLQNLDFFDNLSWSFQPQINILLGKNGYGKTYLLRLLISLLQKDDDISSDFFKVKKLKYLFSWENVPRGDIDRLLRFLMDDLDIDWAENAEIQKSDDGKTILIFKDENSVKIKIDEEKEKATLKISDGRSYSLKVKKENGKLNIYTINSFVRCDLERNNDAKVICRTKTVFKESIGKVPVLAIPDMRLVDKSGTKIEPVILEKPIRESSAYHFLYEKPFEEVIQNFLYGLCNRYMDKGKSFEQPLFQLLHKVVRELTDKEFEFNKIVAIGEKFEINVITEGNPEKPLPLQKASQGTLSVLSIFGLIYYYLRSVFPDTPEEEVLKKPAIVFIDEVDAHLHPSWQQRIIGLLRDSFPNVQFIVTAHSPLVVAGCYENEVAVLRKGENGFTIENFGEHFIGTSTSELLKKLFETEDIDATYLYYATQLSLQKDNVRIKKLESKETLKEDEVVELNNLYKYEYYVNEIAQLKKEKEEKDCKFKKAALEAKIRELEVRLNKKEPQ